MTTRKIQSAEEFRGHCSGNVLAIFPYPDDETMAVGGTLAWLTRQGVHV